MNPTEAGTDKYIPERKSDSTPPIRAKGRLTRTRRASRTESKVRKRRSRISPIVTGRMTASRRMALCWFSNCPPQVRK